MNLQKERVEIYDSKDSILGQTTEVSVYNIYVLGEENLDTEFHEAEYHFPEAGEKLLDDLKAFRDSSLVSWYGNPIYPTVTDFRDYPSMSLHIPNSLVHDEVSEKNKAVQFTQSITEELESFLSEQI